MTLTIIFFATDIPIYVAQNMLQSQKIKIIHRVKWKRKNIVSDTYLCMSQELIQKVACFT
jgi:hypothetical protein